MTQSQIPYSLRPAIATDQRALFNLVLRSRINPRGIQWQRFVLAAAAEGTLLGIGQIKTHTLGSRELASIATEPHAQGQGIASAIIRTLIAQHRAEHSQPLYLYCEGALVSFYTRFGFVEIGDEQIPPDMLTQLRAGRIFTRLARVFGRNVRIAVMRVKP